MIKPALYFPIPRGKYEVAAGLHKLSTDFGNANDSLHFQLDSQFENYRSQKLAARREHLEKYYQQANCLAHNKKSLLEFLINYLSKNHRDYFRLDGNQLHCSLTKETLLFDAAFVLIECRGCETEPAYVDLFDAICCQLQEDLAVFDCSNAPGNLCLLHLCFPNYWSAEEKIGRGFNAIHQPVAEYESIGRHAGKMIDALIHKGPFVRFAWGLTTDRRLNHHPVAPAGIDTDKWRGRDFLELQKLSQLYLRIERQTTAGFPENKMFLFTIRTYFRGLDTLNANERLALKTALESMSNESKAYKGLSRDAEKIITLLAV